MKLDHLKTIEQMQAFLTGSQSIAFAVATSKDERYTFVEGILKRFDYQRLKRRDKGIIAQFLRKVSGYSRQQLTRMIQRCLQQGVLKRYQKTLNGFEKFYTAEDVALLAQLDQRHNTPNGLRVKKLCERAYHEFNDPSYERLSHISVSHIYNLRASSHYKKYRCHYEKTKSTKGVAIGERRQPQANGKPGYIRIDTVHQGDFDGRKGVYHINAVDEVTQFEVVASVEKISEAYLIPVLKLLLAAFPFKIINFHSDNGGEYVNKTVARLLKKLLIEFTKSRPRQTNDNSLVEGKNAAVVRKTFGYAHIEQRYAKRLNQFNQQALNPYINYHRPCLFPTIIIDQKGKQKKKYEYKNMMTPYEKFKSLPDAHQYLKTVLTFKELDDIAKAIRHQDLLKMLSLKIKDKIFLRYITRMLKAEIQMDNELKKNKVGLHQGSILSPILANVYAHYAIDLWFEKVVPKHTIGKVGLFRFCDDMIVCCTDTRDIDKLTRSFDKRLSKFGLKLNLIKTKCVIFNRYTFERGVKQESFEFLGFTFYLSRARKDNFVTVKVKTSKKTLRDKLNNVKTWVRLNRFNGTVFDIWLAFCRKLQGHIAYFGVTSNGPALKAFMNQARRIFFKWMNRRSQRRSWNWEQFATFEQQYPMPKIKIYHQVYKSI